MTKEQEIESIKKQIAKLEAELRELESDFDDETD